MFWFTRRFLNEKIDRQEKLVDAYRESEAAHPGLYTEQVAKEESVLTELRAKLR